MLNLEDIQSDAAHSGVGTCPSVQSKPQVTMDACFVAIPRRAGVA